MTTRHAVISGASIAGLSAAFWLRRIGWQVTVIERAESFRDGGQNVDVRGIAHEVLDLMGLTDAVRAQNTTETGTVLVDEAGHVTTELPSDGADGATAELEVLRGDFARVILEQLPEDVRFCYGDSIGRVDDMFSDGNSPNDGDNSADETSGGVMVETANGQVLHADLLIVAEGVRSTTRDLIFGDEVDARDTGITMAFGTIERTPEDNSLWRWFTTTGGRQVHLRPDNHGTTRAILAYAGGDDIVDLAQDDAVRRLRERFADAGWQAPRILDGFATSDDLYVDRLTQIHMATWHKGQICLTGDAAWCVTPIGGGGASLALISGYVLAAYLSAPGTSLTTALESYETWMRPVVDSVQKLPPGINHLAYPRTALGLAVSGLITKAMASKPLASVMAKMTSTTETDQDLPPIHHPA